MTRPHVAWLSITAAALGLVGCVSPDADPPSLRTVPVDEPTSTVPVQDEVPSFDILSRSLSYRVRTVGCTSIRIGSAIPVGSNMLLTNAHVVDGEIYAVRVSSWDGVDYDVQAVAAAADIDLAILQVDVSLPVVVALGADPVPGQRVALAGYPHGEQWSLSEGTVIDYVDVPAPSGGTYASIRVTAQAATGNSGGPLLDLAGTLVGVVYAVETTDQGDPPRALAFPVSALAALDWETSFFPVTPTC